MVSVQRRVLILALCLLSYRGAGALPSLAASSEHTTNVLANGEPLEQFLDRASRQADEYTSFFVDLTAEENKVIELYDQNGKMTHQRNVTSQLVIYESQLSRGKREEYRDVEAVNGKVIKEREQRIFALMRGLSTKDPDFELDTIKREGNRYDLHYHVRGFTLLQALPLRSLCRPGFRFELLQDDASRHQIIVGYEQVGLCTEAGYLLPLPSEFQSAEFRHCGRFWFDATTAQLQREEREVRVRAKPDRPEFLVTRFEYEYASSNFGLLLPQLIQVEIFDHPRRTHGKLASLGLGGRLTMNYGAFSRFDVSTSWKAMDVEQTPARK
jgi:hypothetical protein